MEYIVVGLVALLVTILGARYFWPRPRVVREHEQALRYRNGHLVGQVGPGRYWLRPRIEEMVVLDIRRKQLVVNGQEVLTQDRVPIKLSLLVEFKIADAARAILSSESFERSLYGHVQLAIREALASRDLDAALSDRGQLGTELQQKLGPVAEALGLELETVDVRDYMMSGGLRNAYADVIQAKQQGLSALERARGESAALRNLANAAQLLEKHPGLARLRVLQALESGANSRIIVSIGDQSVRDAVVTDATGDA